MKLSTGVSAALITAGLALGAAGAQTPAAGNQPGQAAAARPDLSISAREQPIGAFLRDLFGRVGRPVVPSPNLTGTVSGVFRGSVERIYADIARAFNLVSYNDGAALYVYAASELGTRNIPADGDNAARVVRQARARGLPDRRNQVRASSDGLVATGTPRFIEQIAALARDGGGAAVAGGGGANSPVFSGLPGAVAAAPPPVQPLEFRVFYLRYARAEDTLVTAGGRQTVVPGLATILQNLVLDQRPGGSALSVGPQFGARPIRQSQPRLKGTGLAAIPPSGQQIPLSQPLTTANFDTDVLGGEVDGYGGGGAGLAAPLTQDIVRIEPSSYLNAIIVRDVPERMDAYDSLIRALDVEPQIVEVEATIIDINVDRLRRLGINWRLGSGGFGFLFGNGDANSDTRLLPTPGSRRGNVDNITPSALGGTISTIIGSQREFLGRITALEDRGAARIVSRPQVMTLSNVEAIFDRTRTFYVRVAGRAEVDLFNVTAGTVLRVNPHVFRDQDQTRIRMVVNIEDGSISPNSVVENIPIVDRSSVATQAMVLDGESLLLGGMITDADQNDEYRVPLLGDIPLLGELFKFRNRARAHTERLFLITPRLVPLASRVGPTTVSSSSERVTTPMQPVQPVQPTRPPASIPVPPAPNPGTRP
ncbi:type III secretion system outer membrane ring subunit SctC [Sphingomonas lenta]|nr:type III secretion system outer membrane ring subunit SctC [Sphingomonas lenta]